MLVVEPINKEESYSLLLCIHPRAETKLVSRASETGDICLCQVWRYFTHPVQQIFIH